MKLKGILVVLSLAALLLSACARMEGRPVEILMEDYYFSPGLIEVAPGERIAFHLTNLGSAEHEFESAMGRLKAVTVRPGQTRKVTWTAPQTPGALLFECDLHDHEGMKLLIIVR